MSACRVNVHSYRVYEAVYNLILGRIFVKMWMKWKVHVVIGQPIGALIPISANQNFHLRLELFS